MTDDGTVECRSYTRARRYQIVIGSVGGTRLPFGPYTYTQSAILVMGVLVVLLTRRFWVPVLGGLTGGIVMLLIPAGLAYLVRNARPDNRSPVVFAVAWLRQRLLPVHHVNGRRPKKMKTALEQPFVLGGDQ